MSVIWSGVTEEGAVVPVQVTDEGKVVAVGDGPQGDYLPITGGNLTGDLTLGTDKITLNTDGSAEFVNTVTAERFTGNSTRILAPTGNKEIWQSASNTNALYIGESGNASITALGWDGSATFAGEVKIGGTLPSAPNISLNADGSAEFAKLIQVGDALTESSLLLNAGGSNIFYGYDNSGTTTSSIGASGSATFSGDVVIGSRGSKWLIRESNGVAMLIEQTLRQPRMQKVRDLPNELDLIEAALNEIMEKLRMTPPAGWPVWDGQDEVTSDNDNA